MEVPKTELGKFLLAIQFRDNLSKREFANKLHCSSDTVTRMIDAGEQPTIKFLRSVSGYTGKSLLDLLRMSFPDEIPEPSTKGAALGEKIDRMPEPGRSFFIDMIDNADTRGNSAAGDESEIGIVKK